MDAHSTPFISSFVIRFVVDAAPDAGRSTPYRGTIRHIQTEEEKTFNTWEDAVAFIRRFVPLEAESGSDSP